MNGEVLQSLSEIKLGMVVRIRKGLNSGMILMLFRINSTEVSLSKLYPDEIRV